MPKRDKGESGLIVVRPEIFIVGQDRLDGHRVTGLADLGLPSLFLIHNNTPEVYKPPLKHKNSQAEYLLDYYKQNDRILVSYLPPNARSSRHYHNSPVTEYYWLLTGQLYLLGRPVTGKALEVKPGEIHQVETREKPALVLILMKNARLVPEEGQHIYCPQGKMEKAWKKT